MTYSTARSIADGWPALLAVGLFALLLFVGVRPAAGQPGEPLAPLLDGMGDHTRPVATDLPMAQRYFDQGLVLTFAFNHAEAVRAAEAAALQPCIDAAWKHADVTLLASHH